MTKIKKQRNVTDHRQRAQIAADPVSACAHLWCAEIVYGRRDCGRSSPPAPRSWTSSSQEPNPALIRAVPGPGPGTQRPGPPARPAEYLVRGGRAGARADTGAQAATPVPAATAAGLPTEGDQTCIPG